MCTILIALGVWPGVPLVVAANRDEALGRPAESPRLREASELSTQEKPAGFSTSLPADTSAVLRSSVSGSPSTRAVLAPRDLVAGGTWLGVSDRELVVAITNRYGRPADKSLRSRGELVSGALGAEDRASARAWVESLDVRHYNRFHLVLLDRCGGEVLWSDGEQLHRHALAPGSIAFVTERSFGAGTSRRHEWLEQRAAALLQADEPSLATWRAILAEHWPHEGQMGFDSMCVHADAFDYGTRSSTLIRLASSPDSLEFHHAPGRPCLTEFVDHSDAARRLLGR